MLPYTPLHHLLFAAGAPEILVMTSANRSSEPIAYRGRRRAAATLRHCRRIPDRRAAHRAPGGRFGRSRWRAFGPAILRRARGYAPGAVATLPSHRPILALGADLKNTITLVVDGQAFVSQHIGDLDHYEAFRAFQETDSQICCRCMRSIWMNCWWSTMRIRNMFRRLTRWSCSPRKNVRGAASSRAHRVGARRTRRVGRARDRRQLRRHRLRRRRHHLGRRNFCRKRARRFSSVSRICAPPRLPGGDAAASHPVQAAAGFLAQLNEFAGHVPLRLFHSPSRYRDALQLVRKNMRTFRPLPWAGSSTRPLRFWVSRAKSRLKARPRCGWSALPARSATDRRVSISVRNGELDFRPLLRRHDSRPDARPRSVRKSRAPFSAELRRTGRSCCRNCALSTTCDTVVLSGGVFQNELLLER